MKKLEILNDFFEFKDKYSKKIFYKRNNTHKIIFLNNIWGLGNQINIRKEKIKIGTPIQNIQKGERYDLKIEIIKSV